MFTIKALYKQLIGTVIILVVGLAGVSALAHEGALGYTAQVAAGGDSEVGEAKQRIEKILTKAASVAPPASLQASEPVDFDFDVDAVRSELQRTLDGYVLLGKFRAASAVRVELEELDKLSWRTTTNRGWYNPARWWNACFGDNTEAVIAATKPI